MKILEINRLDGYVRGVDKLGRRFKCTIYQNLSTGQQFYYHHRKKYLV